ncbi:MAG: ATP-binding cassette domain-containing protein [Prevotellaceae bacterium]|nr:ATP-binding cassette domain-containing protein [Prevotellaceae bacterium]
MLFDDQINKRRERETASLREVFGNTAKDMGFKVDRGSVKNSGNHVLHMLLEYLKVKDYVLDDDGFMTPDEQLERILRPIGIMQRRIKMEGEWWKSTVGPKLGQDKDGNMLLFVPRKWVFGYKCIDADGVVRIVNSELMKKIKPDALDFYPALPTKALTGKDLLKFVFSGMPTSAITALMLAALVVSLFGMFIPFINKQIFNNVIPNGILSDLYPMAALFSGVVVGSALIEVMRNKLIYRVMDIFKINLQTAFMARIFTLDTEFFWKYSSGEITNRVASIRRLSAFANESLRGALFTLLFSVVYVFQILVYAKDLLAPSMVLLAVQSMLIAIFAVQMHNEELELADHKSVLDGMEYDLFSGIQKIKLTGSEKRAFTKWLDLYRRCAHISYNPSILVKIMPALLALCQMGSVAVLYWYAVKEKVGVSDFIAFSVAYGMIASAFSSLTDTIPDLAKVSPILKIAAPILKTVPELQPDAPQVQYLSGSIEVSDISFRYGNESNWLFRHFNLRINPGDYVAIVGPSGCGKSTLLRLLLGFEHPQSGGVFYDNYDLSKCDKTSLRRLIGTCLQGGSLFSGDIFSNITITAPDSTLDDAWRAAELAGIADDIRQMPMQMQTVVSEGNSNFSGGQKQRILIARALIANPSILLLDEATSALDNISQRIVSEHLDKLDCTRIVVAHRLSTIRNCNRIIVLDKGTIVEEGNYEELMAKQGLFYKLAKRQI